MDVIDDGKQGLPVVGIPKQYHIVVHSATASPEMTTPEQQAASIVSVLTEQAEIIGAEPVGCATVINSQKEDRELIERVAAGLAQEVSQRHIGILDMKNNVLGDVLSVPISCSGTMISITKNPDEFGVTYVTFNPRGRSVSIHTGSVGVKTRLYELTGGYHLALNDSIAIKTDDKPLMGATVEAISDIIEMNGQLDMQKMRTEAARIAEKVSCRYALQSEDVGSRLRRENDPAFTVSGSVVCTLDEVRVKNPLRPNAGDHIIAIRGVPNPGSNDIASKIATIEAMGEQWCRAEGKITWHGTEMGKKFLEYLAAPSTILHPVFTDLIRQKCATSVFSVGRDTYNGRYTKSIVEHGLFVRIEDIFEPDWRELALAGYNFFDPRRLYQLWPMGNDGFVTTRHHEQAIDIIQRNNLEARLVGKIEAAKGGRSGIEIKTHTGHVLYFNGK